MDVGLLLSALENDKNESILKENISSLENSKDAVLKTLNLTTRKYNDIRKKLALYRYVDELPEMKYGSYIRWINLNKLRLTTGGIVCEIKVTTKGLIVVCKNAKQNYFQLNMTECLIFRKLTNQELVLLTALDFINAAK